MPTPEADKKKLLQLLDDAAKFERERNEWRNNDAERRRTELKLKTSVRQLEKRQTTLQYAIDDAETVLAQLTTRTAEQQAEQAGLEQTIDRLESNRADKATELADLNKAVNRRKVTIDSELAAYSDQKKEAIKADILTVGSELDELRRTAKELAERIDAQRGELAVLNQAAIDEQEDLKVLKADISREVRESTVERDALREELASLREERQKLIYERDKTMASIQAAREEHDGFRAYEEKARKLLDAKDRELQEKSADISEQAQFMSNSRSFLPKL